MLAYLFRLQVSTRHAYSESAQSDTPRDRYDTIIIKSTLLRKPLHYLIWWGNMDMHWSWWRVISINLNSPSLLYILLLNLHFRIWMYSVKISEVWNQMLLKNPIYFELMLPCACPLLWWRVISINLNSPSLLYVLLLNLPFRIWMYSAKISEVWNQMLLKNPICFELMLPCVCSFIKSSFSELNSQCENFWNLETKYVAKKKPDLFELMLSCYCCSILPNER